MSSVTHIDVARALHTLKQLDPRNAADEVTSSMAAYRSSDPLSAAEEFSREIDVETWQPPTKGSSGH